MKKHLLSLLIIGFAASSVAPLAAADPRYYGFEKTRKYVEDELAKKRAELALAIAERDGLGDDGLVEDGEIVKNTDKLRNNPKTPVNLHVLQFIQDDFNRKIAELERELQDL